MPNAELDLLRAQIARLRGVLAPRQFELVEDPRRDEPSATRYPTEQDRADPHIMAICDAMQATNALLVWFGQDTEPMRPGAGWSIGPDRSLRRRDRRDRTSPSPCHGDPAGLAEQSGHRMP